MLVIKYQLLKMSYIHRPAVQPLEYRTLIQLFDIHAKSHPEREAFVIYNQSGQRSSYTFKQMQQRSLFLAASFLRIGWKRGERVVLMIPSQVEFLLSYMALLRIGVNVQLLPSSGKPIDEVIAILDNCQGLVFCESTSASFNNKLQGYLKTRFEDQSKVVLIDTGVNENAKEDIGHNKYTDLLKTGEQLDVDEVVKVQEKVQFDDPAVVLFTSGSTGVPKGVQHTHHSLVNGAISVAKFGFDIEIDLQSGNSECRLFNDRPFYWMGCLSGGINIVLSTGCTLVATSPIKSVKECDVNFLLQLLQNEKCTNALLMAYVVVDLITHSEADKYDFSSLRAALTAGQPLPTNLFKKLTLILPNCKLIQGYALTEVLSVATQAVCLQIPNEDDLGMDGIPPIEIKIIDENQSLLPVGHSGEICIRSPISFLEYVDDKDETSKVISNTGWVHTGDMGVINQKGRLTIRGRKGDMIKRATVKIFPAEVEKVLTKYPDVKEVTVVGIPEVRLYEELCACVIPKHGSALQSDVSEFDEWMTHQWSLDEQGLSLKPEHVLLMEEFPLTKTGKIDRKALRIIAAKKLGVELKCD